ncbi:MULTISPECIES: MarR family winged helix-turn-helix transcriptional regulator [Arthrobacter]|uniref:MarR family transcriptional regulator n=1 Tax=Arthrobacter jinronghuae TaxID=2964609 RepID=A0ABT1NPA6_9MICC|nr:MULTISPECIES: MarR family transcriptional regulator [Arthrobacter]MCQ1948584.1 MarR family transcriptional regulator [Arthrobacter jinronghuae]MCQ1951910.1 MarR family transcriptional regulator [Arthrobacter sp. zg-Y238]MCQ1955952.1 MarR family transcriptional regulator [Arthrobacter jinronghuae]UWX78600.1 MarR family transcriptional regulator [Arthrobacter jinronghuae]
MSTSPDGVADAARFAATDLGAEPVFLMARAASIGSAEANRRLADLRLKVRHYSVLSLACSGAAPTQRELSQFLVLDPSQIVAIVDELERRGAVERQTDPRDRRSKVIVPTEDGRALYAHAREVVDGATETSVAQLSAAEQGELRRLLQKVAF